MRIWWAIRFIIILGLIGVIFDLVKFRQFGVNAAVCTGSGEHFYFEHSCVYDSAYGYDCSNSQYGVDEKCVDHGYPSCYYVGKSGTVCKNTGWNDSCAYTTIDPPAGTDGTCAWCDPDCSCAAWTCTGYTCTDPTCSTSCAGTAGATNGDWGDCDANCDRSCVGAYCGGTCTATKPTCAVNGTWGAWSPGCSPECGQPVTRTCDGASCGGTCLADGEGVITSKTCGTGALGKPVAPTPVLPTGTALNPAIFLINTPSITFDWSDVNLLTDYYRVYVIGATSYSDPNVPKSISQKAFGPFGVAGLYHWYVQAVNDTCNGINGRGIDIGPTSINSYFRINSAPTIVKIQVANSDGTLVPNDNPTNNHICKSEFTVTTKPREVVFGIFVNDPDGVGDSGPPPVLHWNGIGYTTVWTGVGGGNNAAQARVDYASYVGDPPQPLHEVTATYSDRWGGAVGSTSPVLPANRLNWKVWNCEVPTYGTLYKAVDAVQNCSTNSSGVGFSDPIDVGVSFDSIIFSDTPDVAMSVLNASDYGPNSIVWGKTYLPFINGGNAGNIDGTLLATGRVTRMIDLGVGTTICPSNQFIIDNSTVSPYSASPRAQIDFSFIRDQEAWYQVEGAGVKSRNDLEYGVPVTAATAIKFLTLGNPTVYNGLVSATSFTNINGNNNENEFGSPNNWWINRNTNDLDIYNYNYFYNNFYVKAGVGETKTNSWGGWTTDKKIYFVNSHLDIDENLTVPSGQTVMVIVSGNITIQPNVTRLDGIYIADGSISAGGINGNQLEINGMLYAGDQVRFYRSYVVKRTNNTTPAVKVNYSPGLIFNLPTEIMKVLSGWREE